MKIVLAIVAIIFLVGSLIAPIYSKNKFMRECEWPPEQCEELWSSRKVAR